MNIQGNVRLQVVVAPTGTVKAIEEIGGSPLLVKAAQDAVYKWKRERAPEETSELSSFISSRNDSHLDGLGRHKGLASWARID